jgi:tRNA A-37 threonylcarbamoyl transferase component Bud32
VTRPDERGRALGRYQLYDEIASGGMGVVHLGRLTGPAGFGRTVAVKRLHPHLARHPEFVQMFLDEARLAGRVRHPNVVSTLDVFALEAELFVVMEYIEGESLGRLIQDALSRSARIPLRIACAVMGGTLLGLNAAHETKGGGMVHRDVSPPNILVGLDGTARVLDFGIAKAAGRLQMTRDGQIKGKAAYMAPEQLRGQLVDARTDIYGASVVFWELLTGERLFSGDTPEETMTKVLERALPPPSTINPEVPAELDALVLRGAARDPRQRFGQAREMAAELERIVGPATAREVGEWVAANASSALLQRAERVAAIEAQVGVDADENVRSLSSADWATPAGSERASAQHNTPAAGGMRPLAVERASVGVSANPTRDRTPAISGVNQVSPGFEGDELASGPGVSDTSGAEGDRAPSESGEDPVTHRAGPGGLGGDLRAGQAGRDGLYGHGRQVLVSTVAIGALVAALVALAIALWGGRAVEPVSVAPVQLAPTPTPIPTPPAAIEPAPARVAAPVARVAPAPSPAASNRKRCNPPYTIDAHGYRVPKAECF